ncbi:hypothetical protein O6H91_08G059200 [Diphasiastrum complanatum]|uniref:Uncharacterized protein n=1 Tax=Diphasiastrum complanatum TaxID=34168 RepID=A0ACC2CXY2_DIPCM|nr:hypothetical protein O6H91_08G059200 [Diphasiastrum complanatum]
MQQFSLHHRALNEFNKGVCIIKRRARRLWKILCHCSRSRRQKSTSTISRNGEVSLTRMNAPFENDYCSVCYDTFNLPCQANCSHWFCGECILRVWQHNSALRPCKCPICRRPITLLTPSGLIGQEYDAESKRVMREISKYNVVFGGGPMSLIQRVRDMPRILRHVVRELMDPQRALFLVHRMRILLCLVSLGKFLLGKYFELQ